MSKRFAIRKYAPHFSASGRSAFAAGILALVIGAALPAFSDDGTKDFEKAIFALEEGKMETAEKFFARAAENGHAEAANRLGVIKHNERKYDEAFKLFKQAAEQEFKPAIMNLAGYYSNGRGCEVNDKEAFKLYLKLAEDGDADAQTRVGALYFNGEGVDRNEEEAVKWTKKAADQNDSQAMVNLGVLYQMGCGGLQENNEEAVTWFRKAAQQGNKNAKYELGCCYLHGIGTEKNESWAGRYFSEILDLLESKEPTPEHQFEIALGYYEAFDNLYSEAFSDFQDNLNDYRGPFDYGDPGYSSSFYDDQKEIRRIISFIDRAVRDSELRTSYEPDYITQMRKTAKKCQTCLDLSRSVEEWFKKSANNGYAQAQYKLASVFSKDLNEKIRWYQKAAEQGLPEAQRELANLYRDSKPPDLAEAKKWYEKAAEKGDLLSQNSLANIYNENGEEAKAFGLYKKVAEQPLLDDSFRGGNSATNSAIVNAQYNLAEYYMDGKGGVEEDENKAFKLYQKVANCSLKFFDDSTKMKQILDSAKYKLGVFYEHGWGVDKNIDEAIKWYKTASTSWDYNVREKASAALKRLGQK